MSESPREYASLLPTDADISAFLDGSEATILSCRAAMFDYNGTRPQAVPSIAVQFHVESMTKQPNLQNYTVGKPEHRVPSEDGSRFKVFSGKSGLPKDSNGLKFITSLVNAGFPADKLSDDLTVFEGMKVKLRTEAVPKADDAPADAKDRTLLVVDQIIALPWENKDGAKKAAAAAKATPANKPTAGKPTTAAKPTAAAPAAAAPAATAGSPLEDAGAIDAATAAVTTLLADEKNGGSVDKAKLGPLSFRILSQNANRLGATKLLSQLASDFLPTIVGAPVMRGEDMVGTVAFDGSKVTLEAAA